MNAVLIWPQEESALQSWKPHPPSLTCCRQNTATSASYSSHPASSTLNRSATPHQKHTENLRECCMRERETLDHLRTQFFGGLLVLIMRWLSVCTAKYYLVIVFTNVHSLNIFCAWFDMMRFREGCWILFNGSFSSRITDWVKIVLITSSAYKNTAVSWIPE